MGLDQHEGQ